MGEHLANLSRSLGNNESDEEWGNISEGVLEYIGLSSFDYDDLAAYALEKGAGSQDYFM